MSAAPFQHTHLDHAAGLVAARPLARTRKTMCGAQLGREYIDNSAPTCPACREYFIRAHLDDMRALVNNLEGRR